MSSVAGSASGAGGGVRGAKLLGHCARTPALIRGFLRIQRPSLLLLLGEHGLLRRKHGLLSLLSLLSLLNCGGVELGRQRLR
ncbi:MAG: hypothetical protein WBF86_13035, partial [Mycobacterium sp.]